MLRDGNLRVPVESGVVVEGNWTGRGSDDKPQLWVHPAILHLRLTRTRQSVVRVGGHNQIAQSRNFVAPGRAIDAHLLRVTGVIDSQIVDEVVSDFAIFLDPI